MTKYKYNKEAHPVNVGLLSDGKVYKNYSALAKEMGWTIYKSDSNGQKAQFKRLSEVCRWSKDLDENGKRLSNKIIIHEVYEKPIPSVDKRSTSPSRITHFPGYCIPEEHDRSIGVYRIICDNEIYIGSTSDSFRSRFLGHVYSGKPLVPTLMIERGGRYELIEVMNGFNEKEVLIREQHYIDQYKQDQNFVLVNQVSAVARPSDKYKRILVSEVDYELAISLLKEHGIQLKPDKKVGDC